MPSLKNLKEVQKLNGSLTALGRFIARSSDKCKHFFNILKKGNKFEWTAECEEAFQKIKEYLATIPILQKPDPDELLALYIEATEDAVSAVLVKTNTNIEKPIYYVSKTLNPAERNSTKIEQLILALVWATQKLRTYFLTHHVRVPCKAPLEAVLKSAGKLGRIAKWNTHLDQFNIIHEIQTAQKSQVLSDFLADLPLGNEEEVKDIPEAEDDGKYPVDILEPSNQRRWEVFIDGSRNREGPGIGIVTTTPTGDRIVHALRMEFKGHTNNIVEYEAVVHALQLIIEMGITDVRLTSDSQLVIRKIELEYNVYDETLSAYMALVQTLASQIPSIKFRHLCGKDLGHADAIAYISSMMRDESVNVIKITRVYEPSITPQQSFATNQIVSDNDKQLQGKIIDMLFDTFKIRKNKLTPIYPQSSGQAEATDKTLALILKKSLDEHKGRWCEQLHNALWAYRTTCRSATRKSRFLLTYGAEAVIRTKIIMPTTKTESWEKNLIADMMLERLDDLK
ncbi:uncharacterized protein LOC113350917 [Papaver somniferum]|uniref:uncharacterized protein LOC113350917 n=1 Tax=Papaver somniferum TaxID=3469 RepID=UPI000E6FA0E0|nr:uncharacterized protein LOC113350917 [Papaver somniferum]